MLNNTRGLVCLLLCLTLLGVSGTDIYVSSLPQMLAYFNTTPVMINSTLLYYTSGMAISVLFSGVLSNRFGRKNILVLGSLVFSIAALLIALVPNVWLMLMLRALQGIGCGCIIIVQRLILRDVMTESEQIHAGSMLTLGTIISPAVAPVIGAFLTQLFNWQACFLFSAIFGVILTLVCAIALKETNSTKIDKLPRFTAYLKDYILLLGDPYCVYLIALMCLTFATYLAFLGVSSYLYITVFGLSPLNYSYIFIILALSSFVGNRYMVYLNSCRVTANNIIKQGIKCSVIAAVVLTLSLLVTDGLYVLISLTAGVMFMRVSSALILNPLQTKIVNHFKERGALALGIAICCQFGSGGFVATIVGKFPAAYLLTGFVILADACLLLAALSFMLGELKPAQK